MKVIGKTSHNEIASVYVAEFKSGKQVEFVESTQPPYPRGEKWVLVISTLYGCPVGCSFCDAGLSYGGKLTALEMLAQIDLLISQYYPDKKVPVKKFKIQFSRMGEPALNQEVLSVLNSLPEQFEAPGLIPSISTIAPKGSERFFKELLKIKDKYYHSGKFQLQFSIHTTDQKLRDTLIPIPKLSFAELAGLGGEFFKTGDRKITLNFARAEDSPLDPEILSKYFNPDKFLVKITPINPTYQAQKNGMVSYVKPGYSGEYETIARLEEIGYEVILSIGELEENKIGSNCGQYLHSHFEQEKKLDNAYLYKIIKK
ncbi:MAG: radical SAM protein [bacterium]|nr:radical SAM protein [bacterium]